MDECGINLSSPEVEVSEATEDASHMQTNIESHDNDSMPNNNYIQEP